MTVMHARADLFGKQVKITAISLNICTLIWTVFAAVG